MQAIVTIVWVQCIVLKFRFFMQTLLGHEIVKIPNLFILQPVILHIGNLKIISDSRIRYIVSKGPKHRFLSRIDFKKCREEIASALNDFGNQDQDQDSLLLKRRNDNHSPGPVIDGVNASMLSLTP